MRNHFLRASGVPSSGNTFNGVTTDLEVHYDFSRTDCWNRGTSTNAADYTVNNLAKNYNDAVFRSRTGSSDSFRDGSDSPCITFNSSDGGGCLEMGGDNMDGNEDICALMIPGAYSSSSSSNVAYNISTVAASSSDNLFNGLGNGAFTVEMWTRLYANESDGNGLASFNFLAGRDSAQDDDDLAGVFFGFYYNNGHSSSNKDSLSLLHHTGSSGHTAMTPRLFTNTPGTPASGAGWSDWLHIVMVRESGTGSNNWKVYVNNTLEEQYTRHMNFTALQYGRLLYAWTAAAVQQRLGIYRAYKGKALTSSEVTTNWNAQKSRFGH